MNSWRWFPAIAPTGSAKAPVRAGDRARCHQGARRRPTGRSAGAIHSTGPVAVLESRAGYDFRAFASVSGLLHSPCDPRAPVKVGADSLSGDGLLSRTGPGLPGKPFSGCTRRCRSLLSASFRSSRRLELGASNLPYRPHPPTVRTVVGGLGSLGITTGWSRRVASLPAAQPDVISSGRS
jgi:hypothetical protein